MRHSRTMTFKVIRGQGQGHVRLKVSKITIFKFYLLRHFSTNQKNSNGFWYLTKISKIALAGFLNFHLVIKSRDFKLCQKIYKNFFHPILMKLGMMLEVDETFTTIWLSRSSEVRVKVRRWPQSPIGTIFFSKFWGSCLKQARHFNDGVPMDCSKWKLVCIWHGHWVNVSTI